MHLNIPALKTWLDEQVAQINQKNFVANDPISIPRAFLEQGACRQSVEIAAFFSALLAWGKRSLILKSGWRLMDMMQGQPYEFVMNYDPQRPQPTDTFVHRTFQPVDLRGCLLFLQAHYAQSDSLETAFSDVLSPADADISTALDGFSGKFFATTGVAARTRKHLPAPVQKSACKRLCMLLRWLVRKDAAGVDLGIWEKISPSQLVLPLDVHVLRVVEHLGIANRPRATWKTAQTLTDFLRRLDPQDPARYDFALFGMGELLGKQGMDKLPNFWE